MPTRSILDRLNEGEVLLMDGGTGTELQRRGVNVSKGTSVTGRSYTTSKGVTTKEYEGVWSAAANVDAPGVVRNIHEDYLKLGADIIISNMSPVASRHPTVETFGRSSKARRACSPVRVSMCCCPSTSPGDLCTTRPYRTASPRWTPVRPRASPCSWVSVTSAKRER